MTQAVIEETSSRLRKDIFNVMHELSQLYVVEDEKVLKVTERNKKKAAKFLEKVNQAMKEVEAMEIQVVVTEARCKAEKEAIEEKAGEVIEVEG